jgi:transposase
MKDAREKQLLALLRQRDAQIEELKNENALLRQKVDLLIRKVFGASSEKLDPSQLDLFLFSPENPPGKTEASFALEEAEPQRSRHRPAPKERQLPENLPVIEKVIDPEEVKAQPEQWRCIGSEVSEQLDYEPARFVRHRIVRRKYVSKTAPLDPPVIAELPPMLQERCTVAPGLLAQIIVGKYCDHLPLYRQEQIFWSRHRVWLPRQNLARWMGLAADWLKPIWQAIRTGVMGGGYVQIDETPIPYLEPGHGTTKTGYLWTASQPGGDVVFHWETSRAAACLEKIVPVDFRGTVQCDGYAAYASFARDKERIQLAACWAHVRRKFYDAQPQAPGVAGWVLRQIGHLYRIERELRHAKIVPTLRAVVRAHRSRPIVERLHRVLIRLKTKSRYLPKSGMGQAIDYTLNLWPLLGVYLGDGRLEIDQNLVENAIRPTALGKKNWLFFGEADAGERSAILYTLVECCRRRGLDPLAYLRHVLTRLPSSTNWQVKDLTPEAWAAQGQAIPQAA